MNKVKLVSQIIVVIFVLTVGFSFVLPETYFVERSIEVNAAKEKILYQLVNLNEWEDWNPWYETDPQAKIIYEGPTGAVGSRMIWEGPKMGTGEIEITKIVPLGEIEYRFLVKEPTNLVGQGRLVVLPVTDHYSVKWIMSGPLNSPFERLMGILLEQRLGSDFNRGLNNLKRFVELEKNPFELSPPGSLLKTEQEPEKEFEQKVLAAEPNKKPATQNLIADEIVNDGEESNPETDMAQPATGFGNDQPSEPVTTTPETESIESLNEDPVTSPMESELDAGESQQTDIEGEEGSEGRNPIDESNRIPSGKIDYE